MHGLSEAMKGHAARATNRVAQNRIGIVSSYDPGTGMVKVEYQPEGDLSPWLQRTSPMVGNGWGIHAPLPIGTQVLIAPVEGDHDAGVVIGAIHSNKALPPGAADGEIILQSETGAIIHLLANGQAVMEDASGASLTMQNNGTVGVDGVLSVTGNVLVNGEVLVTGGPIKVNGTPVIVP